MKSKFPSLSKVVPSSALVVSLYILEFSALVIAMAVNKKGERSLLAFIATPAGVIAIVAVAFLVISISAILLQLRNSPYPWTQWLAAHLVLNLCSVVLVLATAEVVIRLYAVDNIEAPMFANTVLRPHSWERVAAHSRALLVQASAQGSYLVYDNELGWTVGRSRRSQDYNRESVQKTLLSSEHVTPRIILMTFI